MNRSRLPVGSSHHTTLEDVAVPKPAFVLFHVPGLVPVLAVLLPLASLVEGVMGTAAVGTEQAVSAMLSPVGPHCSDWVLLAERALVVMFPCHVLPGTDAACVERALAPVVSDSAALAAHWSLC